MRTDATALITTPNLLTSDRENPFHVHEYAPAELEACLRRRFEEVEMLGITPGRRSHPTSTRVCGGSAASPASIPSPCADGCPKASSSGSSRRPRSWSAAGSSRVRACPMPSRATSRSAPAATSASTCSPCADDLAPTSIGARSCWPARVSRDRASRRSARVRATSEPLALRAAPRHAPVSRPPPRP